MSGLDFSDEEQTAISLYSKMPVEIVASISSVAAEVVPAVACFAYGVYRGKLVFLILGMFLLIYMIGYRVFKQFRYAKLLKSICSKIIAYNKAQGAA